jgi:hypothetical protein
MNPLVPVLSMQVTYQCNVACRHCGPYCAPEQKDWMSTEEIRDLITQAAELGAGTVVFTGGEPSLLGDDLPPLFRFIHQEVGLANSRIVTNAKFASSYEKAKRILASWQDAGLVEVNISCGEFHQEFIPIEHVANGYRAACDLGFRTVLLAGEFLDHGKGKLSPEHFEEALGAPLVGPDEMSPYTTRCHGMSRGSAMPYGRGREHITLDDVPLKPEADIGSMCDDVLTAFTVHPNGNTTACCGIMVRDESLLNIGNWRTTRLREIAEKAHQDVILNWIRYRGLRDMKEWLEARDPSLQLRTEYQNICDLCAEIVYNPRCQELLARHGHEKRNEIVAAKVATDAVVAPTRPFAYGLPR